MDIDLTGKTAIVTGSAGGIGLAIAAGLARAGARVVVVGRTPGGVDAAQEKLADATATGRGDPPATVGDIFGRTADRGRLFEVFGPPDHGGDGCSDAVDTPDPRSRAVLPRPLSRARTRPTCRPCARTAMPCSRAAWPPSCSGCSA